MADAEVRIWSPSDVADLAEALALIADCADVLQKKFPEKIYAITGIDSFVAGGPSSDLTVASVENGGLRAVVRLGDESDHLTTPEPPS